MQPRDIMRATEPIGSIGAAFYFDPATVAVGKEHGLGGFRFYVIGRGGVLGDVEAAVVRSAFGYFHTDLVDKLWASSCEIVAPRDAARLYIDQAHTFARSHFADIDGIVLDRFSDAATKVIAQPEGASLPLFVALRAEPVPTDAPARAMHQAMVLRELRGSVHLLALAAQGLDSSIAHAIRRPNDLETFGWSDAPPTITEADRASWQRAEDLTDTLLEPAYATLTDAETTALIDGTAALAQALSS